MAADDLPYEWSGEAAPGMFDAEAANGFVGKSVLIGVTYVGASGQHEDHFQMHGIIESASSRGVKVALRGTHEGKSWTMPPNLRGISRAEPGRYGLQQTSEIVENPDFIAIWTVAKPPAPGDTKPSA